MKNEPLCRNSPPKVSGWFHAACRAASAPRLWPMSTGRRSLGYCRISLDTAVPPSFEGYAGLAAYRSSRGPGASSATRIAGSSPAPTSAATYVVSRP